MKKIKLLAFLTTSIFTAANASAISLSCESITARNSVCEVIGVNPTTDTTAWTASGNVTVSGGNIGASVTCLDVSGSVMANVTFANGTTATASQAISCPAAGTGGVGPSTGFRW